MQDLLYLVHRIPYPPNKGDKVRSYHLLQHLLKCYRVHLGTFVDDPDDWRHTGVMCRLCVDTCIRPLNPRLASLRSLTGLLSAQALTLPYYRDAVLQRWVDRTLARHSIKHIVVYSSAMAQYVMHARAAHRVADFVDVDSDKWRQYAAGKPWPLAGIYRREAVRLLEHEVRVAREFDASVVVSKAEASLFRRLAPECTEKVWHVNNGVDSAFFSPDREYADPFGAGQQALVFTGAMDYWPNVDAVEWFAREVFPALHAADSALRFYIVGARPTVRVTRLARGAGVVVTGTVPDIRPYLAHAALAVAPLRVARGTQNKVLEAMAMAKAVIASPEAATGIEALANKELIVATGKDAFAAQVRALLANPVARHAIGQAARARVLADYLWSRNLGRFDRLLRGLRLLASPGANVSSGDIPADRSGSVAP